ncbi:substrate-binding domain-containing protein [bacterium]|nr:substrate-binding domain-containing protein [bacterium]
MFKYVFTFVSVLLLTGCYNTPAQTATSGHLNVFVSEAFYHFLKKETDEFVRLYPQAEISLTAVSTREALVSFINDSLQMVVVDRPFNQEEQTAADQAQIPCQRFKLAEDALAVLVNRKNSLPEIELDTLQAVLNGRITEWGQVPGSRTKGQVSFVCTDRNSGIGELLVALLPDVQQPPEPRVTAGSQKAVYDSVAADTKALGLVSVACLKSISRGDTVYGGIDSTGPVRAVPISTADYSGHANSHRISQASIYAGTYPLHYPLYIYLNGTYSELAAGFCSFLTGVEGQKLVQKFGLVPAAMPVRLVQLNYQAR